MVIIKNCYRENKPLPERIKNAPELLPETTFYYLAFWELNTCRLRDYGPIPWTAINDYAATYAVDEIQADMLVDVIRSADDWFLKEQQKNIEKPGKSAKGGGRKNKVK